MKISIITVSYNSAATIEDTIVSVLGQNYSDLEYIIIDGGSKDDTMKIVEKYKDKISKIVSEKDGGIYDAMNKGVKMATGDIVGILNSDDFYKNLNVLNDVATAFNNDAVDVCYGDIEYIDRFDTKKVVRRWVAGEYNKNKLNSGWIMPHPALFVKKSMYDKFGLFNLDFRIAADYELMLRFLLKGIKVKYINNFFVSMREGGFSGQSYKQRKKGWEELKRAWTANGLAVPNFFILRRIVSKFNQFV